MREHTAESQDSTDVTFWNHEKMILTRRLSILERHKELILIVS